MAILCCRRVFFFFFFADLHLASCDQVHDCHNTHQCKKHSSTRLQDIGGACWRCVRDVETAQVQNAAETRVRAIRICDKQLQLCASHVSFICVVISCTGNCRGRLSRERAGPSMMPPAARHRTGGAVDAFLQGSALLQVNNDGFLMLKKCMCFQLDGQAVMSHSSLPWWLSPALFLDSPYTIWAAVVPVW